MSTMEPWACGVCTFVNDNIHALVCDICHAVRYIDTMSTPAVGQPQQQHSPSKKQKSKQGTMGFIILFFVT